VEGAEYSEGAETGVTRAAERRTPRLGGEDRALAVRVGGVGRLVLAGGLAGLEELPARVVVEVLEGVEVVVGVGVEVFLDAAAEGVVLALQDDVRPVLNLDEAALPTG